MAVQPPSGAALEPYFKSSARTIASRMMKRIRRFMAASVTSAGAKSILNKAILEQCPGSRIFSE